MRPDRRPTFTVVIPAYNVAETLRASIGSVLAQSLGDFELLVVDDGSTDATGRVAAEFEAAGRLVVIEQENAGLAAARNAGLARARGRYVGFLDGDDLWMPDYLREMAARIEAAPDAGIIYPDAWILDDATGRIHSRTALEILPQAPATIDGPDLLLRLIEGNCLPYCSTVKPEAVAAAGGFDASRSAVEDWDLWIRMAGLGWGAARVSRPLAIWRDRPGSMSKDRLLMLENIRDVLQRVADHYPVGDQARSAARRRLAAIDRDARALAGERSVTGARRRTALRAGRARRRLANRLNLRSSVPAEVAAAFPDLA